MREVLDDAKGLNIAEERKITLAANADDIIIIGEMEEDLIRTVERLISKEKDTGLQVNDQKTKNSIIS